MGTTFLLLAVIQIALGLTVLRDQLTPVSTLLYWSFCLVVTAGAILCALMDTMANLRESRQERRDLLETTLREVDEARTARKQGK
jgi:uncharacterized membrane protein YciS (DUF1049 family)